MDVQFDSILKRICHCFIVLTGRFVTQGTRYKFLAIGSYICRLGYILKFLFFALQKLPIISKSSLQMIKIIFIAVLGLHQKVLCFWNGCCCNGDCVTSLVAWLHSLLLPLPRTLTTTHRSAVLPSPLISCNHLIMQMRQAKSHVYMRFLICLRCFDDI